MKKTPFYPIFLFAFFFGIVSPSQTHAQGWQWATSSTCDPSGYEDVWNTTIDNKGDIFISTWAAHTTYSIYGTDTIRDSSTYQLAITKSDPSGRFLWSKGFMKFNTYPVDMTTDSAGNLYLLASYDSGTCSIDGIILIDTVARSMYFVAKFDTSGNVVFAKNIVPNIYDGWVGNGGIAVDNEANIYVTGIFGSSITIGATSLTGSGGQDIFIAKYNSNLLPMWAESFGGTSNENVNGLKITSNGNLYTQITTTSPSVSFGVTTVNVPYDSLGALLVKFNNSGDPIWAKTLAICKNYYLEMNGFVTDSIENVFLTGSFAENVLYFGGDTLYNTGTSAAYVAKCDSTGNSVWAKSFAVPGRERIGEAIATDKCGTTWVYGYCDLATFYDSAFIMEFDFSGNVVNNMNLPTGGGWGGIEVDNKGSFYIGNDFEHVPFTLGSTTLNLQGEANTFVAKYQYFRPGTIYSRKDSNACSPGPYIIAAPSGYVTYDWSDGKTGMYDTVSGNGTYVVTGSSTTCMGTMTIVDTISITYTYPPDTIYVHHDTAICTGDIITLRLPAGWTNYYWNDGVRETTDAIKANGTYWGICVSPCTAIQSRIDTFHVTYKTSITDTTSHNSDTMVCPNNAVSLSAPPGYTSYQWNDGTIGRLNVIGTPGIYWVYCLPVCPDSIALTDTFHISEYDSLQIRSEITNDVCNSSKGHVNVSVNGGTSPYKYLWSNDANGNEVSGLSAGTYNLSLTDLNSCRKTFAILVGNNDCPPVVVHDVITPNGDGINDAWTIENIQFYPKNKVQVFDKWGDAVFEADNYNNDWGGTRNNEPLPDGTYFYAVKLNSSDFREGKGTFTGSLLIKR